MPFSHDYISKLARVGADAAEQAGAHSTEKRVYAVFSTAAPLREQRALAKIVDDLDTNDFGSLWVELRHLVFSILDSHPGELDWDGDLNDGLVTRTYQLPVLHFGVGQTEDLSRLYARLPGWRGFGRNGLPEWFGQEGEPQWLIASAEPSGILVHGELARSDWKRWNARFLAGIFSTPRLAAACEQSTRAKGHGTSLREDP